MGKTFEDRARERALGSSSSKPASGSSGNKKTFEDRARERAASNNTTDIESQSQVPSFRQQEQNQYAEQVAPTSRSMFGDVSNATVTSAPDTNAKFRSQERSEYQSDDFSNPNFDFMKYREIFNRKPSEEKLELFGKNLTPEEVAAKYNPEAYGEIVNQNFNDAGIAGKIFSGISKGMLAPSQALKGIGNTLSGIFGGDKNKFKGDARIQAFEQSRAKEMSNRSFAENIPESIPQVLTEMVPAIMTGGTSGLAYMGTLAGGRNSQQALDEGATPIQALAHGTITGVAEAITEKMFGFVPGMKMFDEGLSGLTGSLTKNIGKIAANYGKKSVGEGIEEVIMDPVTQASKGMLYDKNVSFNPFNKETYGDNGLFPLQQMAESGTLGVISGGILGGGNVINQSIQSNAVRQTISQNIQRDIYSGYSMPETTQSYQKAVNLIGKGSNTTIEEYQDYVNTLKQDQQQMESQANIENAINTALSYRPTALQPMYGANKTYRLKDDVLNRQEQQPEIQTLAPQQLETQINQVNNVEGQSILPKQNEPIKTQNTAFDSILQIQFGERNENKIESEDPNFIDNRTIESIKGRNVNAYQYDNPEFKPWYQDYARYILNNEYVRAGNDKYGDTARSVQGEVMKQLKDSIGNYNDVEKGLQAIIKDKGSENIASAKKIELVIDNMLSDGFTMQQGEFVKPSQEYIELKKQIAERENQFADVGNMDAESGNDINAPTKNNAAPDIDVGGKLESSNDLIFKRDEYTALTENAMTPMEDEEPVDKPESKGKDSSIEVKATTDKRVEPDINIKQEEPKQALEEKVDKLDENAKKPHDIISDKLLEYIQSNTSFTSDKLFEIANKVYGGTQTQGKYTIKDAYDAMELAVNKYLLSKKSLGRVDSIEDVKEWIDTLEIVLSRIPTQGMKRTTEMKQYQQFSTPPTISFVANWIANINGNDVMLEPSAGIGGLAIFAKLRGAKVIVNELSDRRLEVLKSLPFDGFYNENAEQINNILPKSVKPTVVVMNPPFSSTAGRTSKNSSKNAEAHIEQALKRLEENGRLVAIVGQGMADNSPQFKEWWNKIKSQYNVRANFGIDGKNYKKYGTTYNIQMFVIDKNGTTTEPTLTGFYENIKDIPKALEAIRNDRPNIKAKSNTTIEGSVQTNNESRPQPTIPTSSDSGSKQEVGVSNSTSSGIIQSDSARPTGNANIRDDISTTNESVQGRRGSKNDKKSTQQGTEAIETAGLRTSESGRNSDVENAEDGLEKEVRAKYRSVEEKEASEDNSDDIYSYYTPKKLAIKGVQKHPAPLVESAAMSAVENPDLSYVPNLPKSLIESGKISEAQLEFVSYAGQAHSQILPDGTRKGIFNGDGTGVGKGVQIASTILDNFRNGRKKAVWISENITLLNDALRDWTWVEQDPKLILGIDKVNANSKIPLNEGVLFTTYSTTAMGTSVSRGKVQTVDPKSRLNQLVEWLGKDFDGVIAFDEAHNMANSLGDKASAKAMAGIKLQELLPKARILYFSATGATEVSNLAYAPRLGMWGEGTPFRDVGEFITSVSEGGLATMELVAKDMKSVGSYIARNISYKGVEYDTLTHDISPVQKEIYDTLAKAWQHVIAQTENALVETNQGKDSRAKGRIMSQLFSSQQRFFNQILISMSMPSLVKDIKKRLAEGKSIVLQLTSTNEAAQNRSIADATINNVELDDIEISPREMLLSYLRNSFPTEVLEEYEEDSVDGFGRPTKVKRFRPALDSEGNPVVSAEMVELRDSLVEEVEQIKTPDAPIEFLLNTFGAENVSEVTGRTKRLIKDSGTGKTKLETRPKNYKEFETNAFQNGDKRILIFSSAGGTGRSYHASVRAKNQQQRVHYLVQAGWSAPQAMQGFGRTHRSAQSSTPVYVLVTTNIKGQKRFISTIAKRLDQMGALTKGERKASGGIFNAKDNLEGPIAMDTLREFYKELFLDRVSDVDGKGVLERMNVFKKLVDKDGNFKDDLGFSSNTGTFMNRILQLEVEEQNKVFEEFAIRVSDNTDAAIASGKIDLGLENYKAERIEVKDEVVVRTDPQSGAKTKYIQMSAFKKPTLLSYKQIEMFRERFVGLYKINDTGEVRAVYRGKDQTKQDGSVVQYYRLFSPQLGKEQNFAQDTLDSKTTEIKKSEWKTEWASETAKVPELTEETLHMFTGTLLPIWNKLPKTNVKVFRVVDNNGNEYLGRIIRQSDIDATLRQFNAERKKVTFTTDDAYSKVLDSGKTVVLEEDNIKIERRRVSGEYRIEISGDNLRFLQKAHPEIFMEEIQWKQRYFIPTSERGKAIFQRIVENNPISTIEDSKNKDANESTNLESIENKLAQNVNENAPDPILANKEGFIGARRRKPGTVNFVNEEVGNRYEDAKEVKTPLLGKTIARLDQLKKETMRGRFSELERGAKYAELRQKLLQFTKGKDIALYRTLRNLQGVVVKMNKIDYELFNAKIVFMDLLEDAKENKALPFGLKDKTMVQEELDNIEKQIGTNQVIDESITLRNDLWEALKNKYKDTMKSVGFNVDNRFTKVNYFRHLVIEYVQKDRLLTGTGQKLKTPRGSGFLKMRHGYEGDIVSDYLQAEAEVMAQMMFDIERAKVIKYVEDSEHNIIKPLRKRAKEMNDDMMEDIYNAEANDGRGGILLDDKGRRSDSEKIMKKYASYMAMSFSKLEKMQKQDTHWKGENGEFSNISFTGRNLDEGNRVFKYLSELAKVESANGNIEARTILKYHKLREQFVQETLGDKFATWEKIIPQGHGTWQATKGNAMYMTYSIPEQLAQMLVNDGVENVMIDKNALKRIAVEGRPYREMVLPNEVIATLDNLTNENLKGIQSGIIMNSWKQWQLISPRRFFKYNLRNISGDLDKVFLGNPQALNKIPKATTDLFNALYAQKNMSSEMKEWFERGGLSSFLQVSEMGDINELKMFLNTTNKRSLNFIKGYWKQARLATDFREGILRYASYLSFKEQLEAKGKPNNYGGSIPSEINALSDKKDKAYQLSNELLGAYDDISVVGQKLRAGYIPFYSFMEVNMKTYYRAVKNTMADSGRMATIGRAAVVGGKKLPFMVARNIGRFIIGATFLTTALALWNYLFFRDEEEDIPENEKKRAHFIYGRDSNGKPLYMTRLGSLTDALEWFGVGTIQNDLKEVLNGKRTIKEQIVAMAKSPVVKAYNSSLPLVKLVLETTSGYTGYPDPFKPRTIRDRGEFLAQSLGLENEYKAIFGKPTRGYLDSLIGFVAYRTDPKETAYYGTLDAKKRYKKTSEGKKESSGNYTPSEKSNALYNYKLSIRYKDKESADKYLAEYISLGGDKKGYMASMQQLNPVYGIEDIQKFEASLDPKELAKLETAKKYYDEMLDGSEFVNGEYAKAYIHFSELRQSNEKQYKKMKEGLAPPDLKTYQDYNLINTIDSLAAKMNKVQKIGSKSGANIEDGIESGKTKLYNSAIKMLKEREAN